eukprot:1062309-Ditylum_brightwellii.AAC.1
MAFVYCDAKACYDHIVVIMSALAEQAAGLSPELSRLFAATLNKLECNMLTAYRPPQQTNFNSEEHPIHGMGQGSCNAPSKWTCTVNPCLKLYNKRAKGCKLKDPTYQLTGKNRAKIYADDNKTMHNNSVYNANANDLMQYVDKDINLWDNLLWLTGGLLEILKTMHSFMGWQFTMEGILSLTLMAALPENYMKLRREGIATTIKRSLEENAIWNLGVHLALNLQITTELNVLKAKTMKFGNATMVYLLQCNEIWQGYLTVYTPSISYSFPATAFIEEDLKKPDTILVPQLLPKLGINRNIKRVLGWPVHNTGSIELTDEWTKPRQHKNDVHLMQAFMESDQVAMNKLHYLNYCKLYLKIEHLTDIASSDRRSLHTVIAQQTEEHLQNYKEDIDWTRQGKPDKKIFARNGMHFMIPMVKPYMSSLTTNGQTQDIKENKKNSSV